MLGTTETKTAGVDFLVNDELIRWESIYSAVGVETFTAAFMKSFKSGDSISIRSRIREMEIKYVLIRKEGDYVENS